MTKIREDLTGSVILRAGLILHAGDVVPDGYAVGDHVLAQGPDPEETTAEETTAEETAAGQVENRPAGNASRDVWADYARSLGLEISEDDKREDIKDLVELRESELTEG